MITWYKYYIKPIKICCLTIICLLNTIIFFECKEVWVVRWGYDYRICAASVADLAGLLAGNVMDLKPCQINLDLPL